MDSKKHFIEGFVNIALQDAIQTLMDQEDPDIDFSYDFEDQAVKSLEIYARHMFDLLKDKLDLSKKFRHELLNFGGDLYIAAVYDPSYTFLDNDEGIEILHGNRLDVYYYVDDTEAEKIGLDLNTY